MLEAGPAAWGWDEDQCWTLARIAEVVRRRFGVDYTLAGLDLLLHRIGWSVQVPARQATERDEARIAAWKAGDVAGDKRTAADLGAWLCFEDESGQGLRPPKGRTWGRRGHTPVVKVTGGSNRRVSLAALIAIKPGQPAPADLPRPPRPPAPQRPAQRLHRDRTMPACWTPRTSSSAGPWWSCGTT